MAPIIRTGTTAITTTDMDGQSLIRLMTWLSPAFPIGGFAYSGGLERAVHDGLLPDADGLFDWLATLVEHGALWNDVVLLTEAWHAHDDPARLAAVAELAEALAGSAERHLEIMNQGEAFIAAAGAWPHPVMDLLGDRAAYSVAVGAIAAGSGVPLDKVVAAYLHALLSQGVSAAIRLGVLGQKQGVAVLARLEPLILTLSAKAGDATLDDLGNAAVTADLMSMRHETQHSRLFRS